MMESAAMSMLIECGALDHTIARKADLYSGLALGVFWILGNKWCAAQRTAK